MSGIYVPNIKLTDKAVLETRFLRFAAFGFGTLCLLSASACTSSNGNISLAKPTIEEALSSAAQVDSNGNAIIDSELGLAAELPKNVPVPVVSPSYQTALLAEGAPLSSDSQSAIAANSVAASASSNAAEKTVGSIGTDSVAGVAVLSAAAGEGSTPSSPTLSSSINNVKIASVNTKAATIGSGTTLSGANSNKTESVPKLNFFQRLLKVNKERLAAKELAEKEKARKQREIRLTRNTVRNNASGSKGGLPGVKKGIKIFGINEESNHDNDGTNVEVASVGALGRTAGAHGLVLQTQRVQVGCFKPELLTILKRIERHYGKKVMVTSGYRSPARNRRAGGVKNSTHTYCKAADIQVQGISKWNLAKYLRSIDGRGGVGTYCRTKSVHIDVGSQRDWHHPCRRRAKRKKRKT